MLPTLVAKPPEGDDWIHEIKLDGYRSQIVINGPDVRIYTKTGIDWSNKYRDLVDAAQELDLGTAIIDGETIVTNAAGLPDFAALQKAITRRQHDLYLGAFDLIHYDGHDLRGLAVEERREILHKLIPDGGRIQFSEEMPGDGKSVFYLADKAGLEGIVSKRRGSKYSSGRTTNWLKTKSYTTSELELLGVERERGKPAFALMAEPGTRKYVGTAFITLNRELRQRLWKRVQDHAGAAPKGMEKRPATIWLKPGLTGRVKHLRGEDKLRHASLQDFTEED